MPAALLPVVPGHYDTVSGFETHDRMKRRTAWNPNCDCALRDSENAEK